MPSVLFLRGVNVGGAKSFSPKALAKALADFDAVNIGAAGTFVVRKKVSDSQLRAEVLRHLPVQAEFMICKGAEILSLAKDDPFEAEHDNPEIKRYVTVLAKRPRETPALPILKPNPDWQVKVFAVTGQFVLSLHRRSGRRLIYPNEVVEQTFDSPATTRNWNTIEAICKILAAK